MEKIIEVFSDNLKRIRKNRDLTQEELSQKCHYDRTYIGKIERGQKYPSLDVISRLSRVLEVPIVDLFMGPEDLSEIKYIAPRKDRYDLDESIYQSIFSARYHLVALFDGEGSVVSVNSDVLELLDREREEVEASVLWEWSLWNENDAERLKQDIKMIRDGVMIREQVLVQLPDHNGSRTRIDLVLTPRSESREDIEYHVMEGLIEAAEEDDRTESSPNTSKGEE